MRKLGVALITGLTAYAGLSAAPQTPIPVGVVRGRVVDAASHQPLGGAVVTLAGANPTRRVVVAADGAFDFDTVPAGTFLLRADRAGYLTETAGQRTPTGLGAPIVLPDPTGGAADVVLPMWRLGAMSGLVMTAQAPLPNVEVHALTRTLVGGDWQWTDAATAMTDDHGRYHLTNLVPGDFLVVARPVRDPETPLLMALFTANTAAAADVMAGVAASRTETPDLDARVPASGATYYSTQPAATPAVVTVAPGDATKSNVDLHVREAHGVRVSGRLTGAPGSVGGLTVELIAPMLYAGERGDVGARAGQNLTVATAACDSEGHFTFSNVAPGPYALWLVWMPPLPPPPPPGNPGAPTTLPLPTDSSLAAWQPINVVGTDLTDVRVPLTPGLTVSGHLVTMAGSNGPVPGLETTNLRLEPVGSEVLLAPSVPASRIKVEPTGAFSSSSVPAGRYLLRAVAPRGWTVVSAQSGDHDLLDDPTDISRPLSDIVVTLTDRPLGGLTTTVVSAGEPVHDATILVFPAAGAARHDTAPAARRFRMVRLPPSGTITINGLPPGDYRVVALATDAPANWQAPATLKTFEAHASTVTVALGPAQPIALELIR